MKQKSILEIGFAWQTLGSDNLGVTALAEANLAIAFSAANKLGIKLHVIQFSPPGPKQSLVNTFSCELGDPLSLKKILLGKSQYIPQLKKCDAIFDIGEGDSFTDIYGRKRFFFLTLSKFLAIFSHIPLILSPQTIGPFNKLFHRIIANWLMKRSAHIFARDGLSMNYLREQSLCTNATEVIDVAFRLPFEQSSFDKKNNITHIGVNVSGLLFNGGYTKNNQFSLTVDYPELILNLLSFLNKREDIQVHLIGHVISDTFAVEDDYRVIENLHKQFPSTIVAPKFNSPSEAKSYISGLDFFTGARMHACIGAFSSGVAVVPMAYSRKFNGLFNSLNYSYIADLKADNNVVALNKIINGLENRHILKSKVDEGNLLAQSKLQIYEDYLMTLFQKIHAQQN